MAADSRATAAADVRTLVGSRRARAYRVEIRRGKPPPESPLPLLCCWRRLRALARRGPASRRVLRSGASRLHGFYDPAPAASHQRIAPDVASYDPGSGCGATASRSGATSTCRPASPSTRTKWTSAVSNWNQVLEGVPLRGRRIETRFLEKTAADACGARRSSGTPTSRTRASRSTADHHSRRRHGPYDIPGREDCGDATAAGATTCWDSRRSRWPRPEPPASRCGASCPRAAFARSRPNGHACARHEARPRRPRLLHMNCGVSCHNANPGAARASPA